MFATFTSCDEMAPVRNDFGPRRRPAFGMVPLLTLAIGICGGVRELCAQGQNAPEERPAQAKAAKAEPATTGTIAGRLVDDVTDAPIAGALIACRRFPGSGERETTKLTDGQGAYVFDGLEPGVYSVWLKRYVRNPRMAAAGDDILVRAGKEAASELRLVATHRVTGRLLDGDGKPVGEQWITCQPSSLPFGAGVVGPIRTSADGTFELFLPPGRAIFHLTPTTAGDVNEAEAAIEVPTGGETPPVELRMRPLQVGQVRRLWLGRSTKGTELIRNDGVRSKGIAGTVVDPSGKPIVGATLFRYDKSFVVTDDTGEFRLPIDAATFVLSVFAEGFRAWEGNPSQGDVLRIVLEPLPRRKNESPAPHVRLIDAQGNPLEGAWVGLHASGESERSPVWMPYSPHGTADPEGRAGLIGQNLEGERVMLYARDERRDLVALEEVAVASLKTGVEVTLVPACRVHGKLRSSQLESAGRTLGWTNVYLHAGEHRPLGFSSKRNEFEFLLPPGKYRLHAYGGDVNSMNYEIEVGPNERALKVETIDLPATRIAMLIGQPAPELRGIRGWKNTAPLRLADLRGKYVLLEFWGSGSVGAVRSIPGLTKLHDALADRGLVVLAIHDSSLATIEELDAKNAAARDRFWRGRELSIPVALDGGDDPPAGQGRPTGHGATTDAYGIDQFPTTLLIDREGKIVAGGFEARDLEKLAALLGVEGRPAAWRERFDRTYRLETGEVLRRIAPPFIPERAQFITAETATMPGNGSRPESLRLVWEGSVRGYGREGGDSLQELLQSMIPWPEQREIVCPPALGLQRVPGDWIVKQDVPLPERLIALEAALRRGVMPNLRIERKPVERDVIVVSGRYEHHPLRPGDTVIHFSTGTRDLDQASGGGAGGMKSFLSLLHAICRGHFVDEATGMPEGLQFMQHDSAILPQQPTFEQIEPILANLSRQTSLSFERQRRAVDEWHVREEK